MGVTFFEDVPFYSPSNAPMLAVPKPSSHTLPISIVDLPSTTSPPKYAAPPIVYTQRPKEVPSTHLPAAPTTIFADPPLVYILKNKEDFIIPINQSPSTLPDIGMEPSSSSALIQNLTGVTVPKDHNEAMTDDRWVQAMNDEILALQ